MRRPVRSHGLRLRRQKQAGDVALRWRRYGVSVTNKVKQSMRERELQKQLIRADCTGAIRHMQDKLLLNRKNDIT